MKPIQERESGNVEMKTDPIQVSPQRHRGTEKSKKKKVFGFKSKMYLNSVPLRLCGETRI
jgi:hypothetical protein